MLRRLTARHRTRDERGAVALTVGIISTVLVLLASFAVDLGMQRVARRDMQALADSVALDLARLVDGRTAEQIVAGDTKMLGIAAAAAASEARNEGAALGDDPTVTWTLVRLDLAGDPVVGADGAPVAVTGAGVPQAVVVEASTTVDFAFSVGSGGASRTAVGASESIACFALGSFAAAVNSDNSALLDSLVQDAINVNVAGYMGLADAAVTLRGLALELGAGTVDELIGLRDVTLRRLFLASAAVLQRESGQAADVALLTSLSAAVDSTFVVDFAELMTASAGGQAALDTTFNLLDLVGASAFVANGENFLDTPVFWKVPQFSSGEAGLQVIQRPQRGCGRVNQTVAETAQVNLVARPKLNMPTILGLAGPSVPVNLEIELVGAKGTLRTITCGAGTTASPESITVQVERSAVSSVKLEVPIKLSGQIRASNLLDSLLPFGLSGLLGTTQATVDLTINAGVTINASPTSTTATFAVPPRTYGQAERVPGAATSLVPHVTIDAADVSGSVTVMAGLLGLTPVTISTGELLSSGALNLDALTAELTQKNVLPGINDFIDQVNVFLEPTLNLLGASAAGADLFGLPRPICNSPSLRG